jgi:plasmid stabilization system protein ParE
MGLPRYQIRITNEALADLQRLAQNVSEDSPQHAAGLAGRILNAVDSLETMPNRFRRVGVTRKRKSEVHAMVVSPFIVYYRIDESRMAVRILAVFHGAQRQPKSFR